MLQSWVIVVCSFAYLGLLFAIAYYADRRAEAGRSVIANPYVYSLSLGVYARLDGIGKAAVVDDPYGKLWVRTIVGVEL